MSAVAFVVPRRVAWNHLVDFGVVLQQGERPLAHAHGQAGPGECLPEPLNQGGGNQNVSQIVISEDEDFLFGSIIHFPRPQERRSQNAEGIRAP